MFGAADTDLQNRLTEALDAVMTTAGPAGRPIRQLSRRWRAVKQFQAERLRATYPDLLASDRYREPCEFFLEELYGAHDFDRRDAEAQRVVPKLAKMLPARAVETLLLAVQLDEMSERFDSEMARNDRSARHGRRTMLPRTATVGSEAERERQIEVVDEIGRALDKLARIPMLSTMLHMMKGPAEMWGLSHLHHFLQRGFDAFAGMGGAREFLATIRRRESAVNRRLFAGDAGSVPPGRLKARGSGAEADDASPRPAVVQQAPLRVDERGQQQGDESRRQCAEVGQPHATGRAHTQTSPGSHRCHASTYRATARPADGGAPRSSSTLRFQVFSASVCPERDQHHTK